MNRLMKVGPLLAALALAAALLACGAPTPTAVPPAATPPAPTLAPANTAAPTATPTPTMMPTATPPPTPTATPAPTATRPYQVAHPPTPTPAPPPMPAPNPLAEYADAMAGGPGAIFFDDPRQLLGPPPHTGPPDSPNRLMLGADAEQYRAAFLTGLLGAEGFPGHMFIFTSDYYDGLLDKARLVNPTELVSAGESIELEHTCIARALPSCLLLETWLAPNLAARTHGQVRLTLQSLADLEAYDANLLELLAGGGLDMANIYGGYVAGELPAIEIQGLWGIMPDAATSYLAVAAMIPEVERLLQQATGGGMVLHRNWYAGIDQWFFSKTPLTSLADFQGQKIGVSSYALRDLARGLGGDPVPALPQAQFKAIDLGLVDIGTAGALTAVGGRLNEAAGYMFGPVVGFGHTSNVINREVWDGIPADLQQIIIEEAAKTELEALRLAPFQNFAAVALNRALGVEPTYFDAATARHLREVVAPDFVVAGWVERLDYPAQNRDAVRIFNEHVGPFVGLHIAADGSVARRPPTRGPHAE